jgi:hypothetical protein
MIPVPKRESASVVDGVVIDDTGDTVGRRIGVVADAVEEIHTIDLGENGGFSIDDAGAVGKIAEALIYD